MKVSDIMSIPAVTVGEDSTLEQVAHLMLDRRIGGVPVVGPDGKHVGSSHSPIFPRGTVRSHSRCCGYRTSSATGWSHPSSAFIRRREVSPLCESQVHRLPVVRDRVPVGIVSRRDLLRLMLSVGLAPEIASHPTA